MQAAIKIFQMIIDPTAARAAPIIPSQSVRMIER